MTDPGNDGGTIAALLALRKEREARGEAGGGGPPEEEGVFIPPDEFLDSSNWVDGLKLTKDGKVKSTLANLIQIFTHHPEWRDKLAYNERSLLEVIMHRIPVCDGFRVGQQLEDQHSRLTSTWLAASEFAVSSSSALIHEALVTVARRRSFDPVRQYFDKLVWDGVARLDEWLPDCVGVDSSDYTRAVGSKFLISAVARTYEPGCKVDTILILCGPQGSLKSSALNVLAGEFFSDQFGEIGDKDSLMKIHGPLLIEMPELDAMSRKESTAIKAFLTAQVDLFRPPYGRATLSFPRRCVFAGTTNHETFLKDDTGGRRFWPVGVEHIDLVTLATNRDQLWAEAVYRYRSKESWWLHGSEEDAAKEEQERRRQVDPWELAISQYLVESAVNLMGRSGDGYDSRGKREWVMIEELLKGALDIPVERRRRGEAMRAGQILKGMGWIRKRHRVGENLVWVYYPPPTAAVVAPAAAMEEQQDMKW